MPVTLRPKSLLRLDVHQAGMVAHKINGIKSLNARLLLLAMVTLTPTAALAEDKECDCCWTTALRRGEQAGEQLLETQPLLERSGVR